MAGIIEAPEAITSLLEGTHRIAVLGMKTEAQAEEPAFYVPKYVAERGYDVIPVPVYYPEATEILGRPVYRRLADVPGTIDMVNVFRRAKDLPAHVEDLLAARPRSIWLQQGIRGDAAFLQRMAEAGIKVVQDHCLLVELRARPTLGRSATRG